jgi:hypothetical protein
VLAEVSGPLRKPAQVRSELTDSNLAESGVRS